MLLTDWRQNAFNQVFFKCDYPNGSSSNTEPFVAAWLTACLTFSCGGKMRLMISLLRRKHCLPFLYYFKLPFNVILSFYVIMIWRTDKRHFPRSCLLSVRPNFKDILLEKIRFVSIWHWKLSIESLTQKNFSTKRYNFPFWSNLWSIFKKKK